MADVTDAKLKILVVEDNEPTLMVMRKLITHMGHAVETATCVADAVAKLTVGRFDLMLSDLGLPDGSGLEILEQCPPAARPAKSIALTGYGDDDDLRQTREAGFHMHLTKPINFDQLKAAIGNA